MEARENAQYNLLMMELLHHLLKTQDPAAVARSHKPVGSSATQSSILATKLKQEQAQRRSIASARHGHFAGTWVAKKPDGNTSFVPAAKHQASTHAATSAKRKNRKAEPFIGSGKALLSHCRKIYTEDGPATQRANESLHIFCKRFIKDCYGPVMKSLKNEFRRDSHRLEAGDKVVFFRIVWFFCQWWRLSRNDRSLGQLIFTMDVFTFNLVLTSTDTFYQHKNHSRLAQAVALYSEMMHLLLDMHGSKDETESMMALGLQDRLFYGVEPIDRLPKLLSRWSPGTSTREYLCDLVELCHVCLKLLDLNKQGGCAASPHRNAHDKMVKMRAAAAQFDTKGYFCRKIVSNQLVSMYCHLLGQYKVNSSNVNHRVVAMLLRISRTEISAPDAQDDGVPINPLGSKSITLEPMLFNAHLLMTAGRILEDSSICKEKEFHALVSFCTSFLNRFLAASRQNPMVFIECLFRHQTPHRFCELFANGYVSEELRMIAEREVLLDEQRRCEEDFDGVFFEPSVQEEDEAENEFDDAVELDATGLGKGGEIVNDTVSNSPVQDSAATSSISGIEEKGEVTKRTNDFDIEDQGTPKKRKAVESGGAMEKEVATSP